MLEYGSVWIGTIRFFDYTFKPIQLWPFAHDCIFFTKKQDETVVCQGTAGKRYDMKLFGTMKTNEKNHLEIGGLDTVKLAETHGTPLYVMDQSHIEEKIRMYQGNFCSKKFETEVIYASKAFLNLAMCRLLRDERMSLDAVSGGEIYTALKAGFPMDKVFFHGNNKTAEELELALEVGVGRIIVDSFNELELLSDICEKKKMNGKILLRVNPGIEAHTHQHIQTSTLNSKFGVSIFGEEVMGLLKQAASTERIRWMGLHCHIGSQIFEEETFLETVGAMTQFAEKVERELGKSVLELNLGGGFGVYYADPEECLDIPGCLKKMVGALETEIEGKGLGIQKVMIEPGRSIVANSGITMYRVGSQKKAGGGKNYIFIDGGMADNIRPALYQAKYEAAVANKMADPLEKEKVSIGGKCCESGDILIEDILLPKVERGDLLVIGTTGAYNHSMASNYNKALKPAVVMVKDGTARVVTKRETYEDLIRNDFVED